MSGVDFVQWLTAALDEEAEDAQRAFSGQADPENGWGAYRPEGQRHTTIVPHVGMIHEAVQADHVVRWNPARALREVEFKRGLLALHSPSEFGEWVDDDDDRMPVCSTCGDLTARFPCKTLRLLASMYEDREGYAEAVASAG